MKVPGVLLLAPALVAALPAAAAPDFRARAAGHVLRCGARVLDLGKAGGVVRLSEFGTTVTAKAGDGSAVCVNVR